jgi:hypothetical protein
MENTFPSLSEAISMFFTHKGREGKRELTPEEVSACADWLEEHQPALSQTLQEAGCLVQLLREPPPRLSLSALGDQTDDLLLVTFGNLLDQEELVHETDPQAWTWEAWSHRHSDALLRLLLLALLQLELGSPEAADRVHSGFPWPPGPDRFRRVGA